VASVELTYFSIYPDDDQPVPEIKLPRIAETKLLQFAYHTCQPVQLYNSYFIPMHNNAEHIDISVGNCYCYWLNVFTEHTSNFGHSPRDHIKLTNIGAKISC